jgi:hypothetical protein
MSFGFGFSLPAYEGYAAGFGPSSFGSGASLALDFLNGNNTLDPRVTFSRTTNATVTGSNGLIQNAPMNLLTFSEQFDNAAWNKVRATVTANTTAAPNGTVTADKLVEDTQALTHAVQSASLTISSAVYTGSCYIKAGERTWALMEVGTTTSGFAYFNLSAGTVGTVTGGYTATITPIGNGWYRCSVSGTIAASGIGALTVYTATANNTASYTGDGTSGIYVWGAQLELGSTATTYNPTTVKNLLGFTENFDNAAWTKSNAFVQTNLVLQSQDFDNVYWTKTDATVSANVVVAPDGSTTADKLVETATTGGHRITTPSFTASLGPYATSVYAKAGERGFLYIRTNLVTTDTNAAWFDLSNGTVGTVASGFAASIQPAGNGWYRCSVSCTADTSSTRYIGFGVSNADNVFSYTGDGTSGIFLWGAQLVQGTTPGDYKATYAAVAAVGYTDIYGQPFAQKLVETTALAQHAAFASLTLAAAPYTFSVYAKQAEGPQRWLNLFPQGTGVSASAIFDVTNGTVTATSGAQYLGSAITATGNGWYRCSITFTAAAVSVSNVAYLTNSSTIPAPGYTGDGTSGIYIFGAQLSDSASVDPYVYQPVAAPTSTAYYGPRFDYDPVTLQPKGLLVEEQRTNLLTYSEQFDNAAWNKASSSTVTPNAAVSPDGATTADSLVENTNGGEHIASQQVSKALAAITYTHSIYYKAGSGSRNIGVAITDGLTGGLVAIFSTSGTVVLASQTVGVATGWVAVGAAVTAAGNGWFRASFTATTNIATRVDGVVYLVDGTNRSYTGNGTSSVLIWGAQLEAGAFATSYIPTVASQVTRAADVATMVGNNFARWYNQNAGTTYVEAAAAATGNYGTYSINSDDNNRFYSNVDFSQVQWVGIANGAIQASLPRGVFSPNVYFKHGAASTTNDFAAVVNGGAVAVDTVAVMPFVNRLFIGTTQTSSTFLNGTIKRIAYYPRRLANTELQAITS